MIKFHFITFTTTLARKLYNFYNVSYLILKINKQIHNSQFSGKLNYPLNELIMRKTLKFSYMW